MVPSLHGDSAGGLRGGTAPLSPRDTDCMLSGTAWRGLAPTGIAKKYVCYRHLMHSEAPIKNKNILKTVKNLVHKYYSQCAFQMTFVSVTPVSPARP